MILYNNKEVIPKYNGNALLKILKNGIILWEGIGDIPTAASYIQDGLVFQLDGIERGDSGWTDLIGGKKFTLYNCTLNDNNVEFKFRTKTLGPDTCKSTYGCFEELFIEPNMKLVIDTINKFENGKE